ncbi:type III secretion system outer membrane ring subunit SctC [Paraburkholderia domus]|uniref:type III secretion system outer membrane ring subunit SctC n=1 Tax=Paraburkholderia domus TaxID=2793075 RepID=UPI0019140DE5|nr:type III secretion system outer membrane ring subunit SctC [Paraburkholderia domus]MBK5185294.1 type III secretion system outer membrane ring subunit SctC [Burkholderia sp. R-69749]CAE6884771.1 Type 3 secretion system secretin [Paraburkholderia domus]
MLMMWRNDSIPKKGGKALSLPPCAIRAAVRHIAGLLGVACPVLLMPMADAATPVWRGAPIHYAVNGAPLPDVLRDVLAVEGLSADIGRDVKGAVNGRFDDSPGNVFIQLVEAYGLVWYFDGKAMHVATASDVRSRVIPFAPMTREAVASLLRNLDLDDPRLPVKYSATTVKVAGPSKFVDAVTEAIDKAQRQTTVEPSFDETVIRVFPLRYAQAQDVHYSVGAQEHVVPGVASLLHRLMTDTWQATAPRTTRPRTDARTDERSARGGPPPLPSLLGLGLGGVSPGGDGERAPLPNSDSDTAQPAATPARRNIVADQRTNSVVISDLVSMMPNYERAIAMLDQPQELVEIDAVVIDVSSNAARTLGVQWGGANGRINGASGTASAPLAFGAAKLATPASAMTGLNLATLVGNSAQYLFAQIHALEDAGKARVLSRPQVLTLNNTEAALTSRSSVYVRVAGNQAVDLFNIDTGMTLKVTPSVESSGEPRRNIRLNIQIEDGTFNTLVTVDGIPKVDNHSVVTQAIVRDGESLLIGGYQYERSESTTSKVPVLGDVPYLGALFRDTRTTHERLERLILMPPRLKRLSGDAEPDTALAVAGTTMGAASAGADAILAQRAVIAASLRAPVPLSGSAAAGSAESVQPTAAVAPNVDVASRALAQAAARGAPQSPSPPSSPLSSPGLPPVSRMPWENRYDR